MQFIERPSPNFDARRQTAGKTTVRQVVVHYTGMKSAEEALARLCDVACKVSSHYFIGQEGTIFRLVPEELRAWHAGVSYWCGARDINSTSIGIELCNPGHDHGYRAFPPAQIASLKALLRDIRARHAIPADSLLAHSDVAPGRKIDPGELFPWKDLAADGFGLWPEETAPVSGHPDLLGAFRRLSEIGYAVPTTIEAGQDILNPDSAATDVIRTFQRRYLPDQIDGHLDGRTAARIAAVAVAFAIARGRADV